MLFVADTFRAYLLAAFGGPGGVAPALDALAARGTRFLAARSPATWTLPAHASLFTGTWPPRTAPSSATRRARPSSRRSPRCSRARGTVRPR